LIFEHVYATHFSGRKGQRVIEVGSAPGLHLLEVRSRFGLDPFGVEYAPAGVALNRQNFQQAGVNPDQVIEADFFSEGFLAAHQGKFDVVLSRGFIEHFSVPRVVVE